MQNVSLFRICLAKIISTDTFMTMHWLTVFNVGAVEKTNADAIRIGPVSNDWLDCISDVNNTRRYFLSFRSHLSRLIDSHQMGKPFLPYLRRSQRCRKARHNYSPICSSPIRSASEMMCVCYFSPLMMSIRIRQSSNEKTSLVLSELCSFFKLYSNRSRLRERERDSERLEIRRRLVDQQNQHSNEKTNPDYRGENIHHQCSLRELRCTVIIFRTLMFAYTNG